MWPIVESSRLHLGHGAVEERIGLPSFDEGLNSPSGISSSEGDLREVLFFESINAVAGARAPVCCSFRLPGRLVRRADIDVDTVGQVDNKLRFLNKTVDVTVQFPKLDLQTFHLVVYDDVHFANRIYKSSQLGYVICLADASGDMSILSYRSWCKPSCSEKHYGCGDTGFYGCV